MNIRNARFEDIPALAEIHVLSWQHTYRGIVPDKYLDSLTMPTREAIWRENLAQSTPKVIVVQAGKKVVGFSCFGKCRDNRASANDGEIWAIYLSPLHLGKGLGRALLSESCEQLIAQGKTRISLWAIVGNERAIHFYQAAGFAPEEDSLKTFELAGAEIAEIRYVQNIS
ncbi:GNAT family N-acetyltransferase [Crenothrix sp.]|uniref:GNAT family N-acetyltransferase n=1 Tax=Crenothrix sp. TaxID=3100433 RepID=UPI00374CBDB9